jgi:hypothetical protein
VRAMGIRDRPISPGSPWQNGIAERLIGTVRRECLDHILIFGESQLRRVLASYAAYYNQTRTHLALQKDAPLRRAIRRSGAIVAIPILAGLHHQYVRIWFSERTGGRMGLAQNIEVYNSAYRLAWKHVSELQKREKPNIASRLHDSIRLQIKKGATEPLFIASEALRDVEFNPETWD